MMTFIVTPQHAAIYSWVDAPTSKAAIIEAVAGSGKSSTLVEILRRIRPEQSACFLAFGKDAAAEIGEKAKRAGLARPGVDFRTLNSMGFRALTRAFRSARLDDNTVSNRLRGKLSDRDFIVYRSSVEKLIGAAKSQGLIPAAIGRVGLVADVRSSWRRIIDDFDVTPPDQDRALLERAVQLARECLVEGIRDLSEVDFDDQLYLPYALNLPMQRFDWLLVDECQDLNGVQRVMLHSALSTDGHLIAVGDPYQAIYGFRGADSKSIAKIREDYGAETFPLSVTYRCPMRVVAVAQQWVPHLRAAPGAAEGIVRVVEGAVEMSKIGWLPTDLILCRMNAPLTSMAYALLKLRVPCRIAGRDFGKGLIALIKKMDPWDVSDLVVKLGVYRGAESKKILERNPDDEAKVEALNDKVSALLNLCEELSSIAELRAIIDDLFSDVDKGRMTLSSVHRAKGAEAPRVFILDPHLMPSGMAKTADARQQEKHLMFVATTRTKYELVYLTPDPAKRDAAKAKREANR